MGTRWTWFATLGIYTYTHAAGRQFQFPLMSSTSDLEPINRLDLLVQAFDANLSRAIPSFNSPLGTVIENHDYVRTLRLGGPIPHSGSAGLWQWCNLQQHGGSLDADLSRVIMRCVVQAPPVGGSLHIALLMWQIRWWRLSIKTGILE